MLSIATYTPPRCSASVLCILVCWQILLFWSVGAHCNIAACVGVWAVLLEQLRCFNFFIVGGFRTLQQTPKTDLAVAKGAHIAKLKKRSSSDSWRRRDIDIDPSTSMTPSTSSLRGQMPSSNEYRLLPKANFGAGKEKFSFTSQLLSFVLSTGKTSFTYSSWFRSMKSLQQFNVLHR